MCQLSFKFTLFLSCVVALIHSMMFEYAKIADEQ